MFPKLASLLALIVASPLVSALVLNSPQGITSEGWATISWTPESGDAPFSLFLMHEEFNDSYAIANNVNPSQGSIDIFIPPVPIRDGYSLRAVNVIDINDVYSSTGTFSVSAPTQSANPNAPPSRTNTGSATTSATESTTSSATATNSGTAANPLSTSGASSFKVNPGLVAAALAGVAAFAVAL